MHPTDRLIAAALSKGISHGDFRLYVILQGVAIKARATNDYFPVTLEGLLALHPGITGSGGWRAPGSTTIVKQIASLRKAGLLDTRAAIHRSSPRKPVLVKVLDPADPELDLANVANTQ